MAFLFGEAPKPEPSREERFQRLKADVHKQLVEMIDISRLASWKPQRIQSEVQALAVHLSRKVEHTLDDAERDRLVNEIMSEAFGLGPLDKIVGDATISDILVNGPREVWIERHGR